MKTSIHWLLVAAVASLFWACGGGSSRSDSNSAAGSSSTTSPCSMSLQGTESAACLACVQAQCSSQYSALCNANCTASSKSSACQKATTDIGTCVFLSCLSVCDNGSGSGGAGGDATGGGGVSSGAGQSSIGVGPTETTACYIAELHSCTSYLVLSSQRAVYDGQCSAKAGQSADTCPTDNLVGCCTPLGVKGIETCGYDAENSPVSEGACTQINGAWAATP